MIKPGYLTTAEVLEPVAPTAATAEINVAEAATDTTRLVIPEADSVTATAATVVAADKTIANFLNVAARTSDLLKKVFAKQDK